MVFERSRVGKDQNSCSQTGCSFAGLCNRKFDIFIIRNSDWLDSWRIERYQIIDKRVRKGWKWWQKASIEIWGQIHLHGTMEELEKNCYEREKYSTNQGKLIHCYWSFLDSLEWVRKDTLSEIHRSRKKDTRFYKTWKSLWIWSRGPLVCLSRWPWLCWLKVDILTWWAKNWSDILESRIRFKKSVGQMRLICQTICNLWLLPWRLLGSSQKSRRCLVKIIKQNHTYCGSIKSVKPEGCC